MSAETANKSQEEEFNGSDREEKGSHECDIEDPQTNIEEQATTNPDAGSSCDVECSEGIPPRFTIVPVVRTPDINPGQSVEIALYCTGIGRCTRSKLFVNFLNPSVFRDDDAIKMRCCYKNIDEDF